MLTGAWADFAIEGQSGRDIISLHALVHNISNLESAKKLADLTSYNFSPTSSLSEKMPNLISSKYGQPSGHWVYKSKIGDNIAIVVRYDLPNKDKTYSQWSFSKFENKWVPKSHEDPRPLYKLYEIEKNPTKTIIVCEGEKAADAAQELFGKDFISTCWIGGSNAAKKTDFSPLFGKNVIIWADADDAGKKCASAISKTIVTRVLSLQVIEPLDSDEKGFDAYDLLQKAPDVLTFDEYLEQRTKYIKKISATPDSISETTDQKIALDNLRQFQNPSIVSGVALPYSEQEKEVDFLRESNMLVKWQDMGLAMKSETKPFLNEQNIIKILKKDTKLNMCVYYDEFFKSYMSTFNSINPEPFSDITFTKFKLFVQEVYGLGDISTPTIKESLRYYASGFVKSEVSTFLKYLKWDGQPRVDSFMTAIYGAENNEYNTAAGRIFWLSLVARILNPSVKADIMVILEGAQGIQKSSSLEEIGNIMGRDFYSTAGKKLDNKDFYMGLKGKFIVEMGEINVIIRNSDEDIKEMLSTRVDNYRIPYASESTPNARTNIFVGTTNQENYLRDETGARRFLPVKCTKVNIDLLKEVKLQLFAEAIFRKLQGEDHWVFPNDEAKIETDVRMEMDDIWTQPIISYCNDNKYQFVRIADIAKDGLFLPLDRQDQRVSNRISKILKRNGFDKIQMMQNLKRTWTFENKQQDSDRKSWIDKPFFAN